MSEGWEALPALSLLLDRTSPPSARLRNLFRPLDERNYEQSSPSFKERVCSVCDGSLAFVKVQTTDGRAWKEH